MYFTNEEQSKFVDNIVKVALNAISNHFRDELNKNPELDDQATEELFLFVISNFESQIESYDNYLNLSDDFFRICEETYREIIIDSIKEIFPQIILMMKKYIGYLKFVQNS
jgi:regulator of replication initiation timing